MANLRSIAELAWRQMFPNPSDETKLKKEDFIATARSEYAYQMLLFYWNEKQREGYWNIPSYLLTEVEKDIVNDEMDISDLKILFSLPQEIWLQNIGGIKCECQYVKSDVNKSQLLCDDDSLGDDVRTYYTIGKKIKFPQGVHADKLTIIYANNGNAIDDNIEVDDAVAGIVRRSLIEIYTGKTGQEDKTNNSNSDQ